MVALPDALHLLMLARLNLPMNAEMAVSLGLADSLMAAASAPTPPQLRIAAAEKLLRAGVLPTGLLGQILDLPTFAPGDLSSAPALARGEPLMPALARLRAALRMTASPEQRADLIHTALEIGEAAGLLRQVALLFVDDAAVIVPVRDWANWSELYMRALLLAGRPDAAARWFNILEHEPGCGCRHCQSTPAHIRLRRARASGQPHDPRAAEEPRAHGESATTGASRTCFRRLSPTRSRPIRCCHRPSRHRHRRLPPPLPPSEAVICARDIGSRPLRRVDASLADGSAGVGRTAWCRRHRPGAGRRRR